MSLPSISPTEAHRLIGRGAILIDVREPDEHARERIPGARPLPLSRLDEAALAADEGSQVVFYCRSGARTLGNADRLRSKVGAGCEAFLVDGGIDGWKKAGLPVAVDHGRPLELQRQVQIGAGGMAFVGTLLGLLVSPWFLAIPLFVGAGLLTAGITGFCGLARLLVHAPWNRSTYRPGPPKAA